jgi:hypothetical protein
MLSEERQDLEQRLREKNEENDIISKQLLEG